MATAPSVKSELECSIKLCFGRYIKSYFGRGPDKITVMLDNQQIIVELYGILNKAEKKAMRFSGAEKAIKMHKGLLMEALCREIDPIEGWLGFPVNRVCCDFSPCKDKCSVFLNLGGDPRAGIIGTETSRELTIPV